MTDVGQPDVAGETPGSNREPASIRRVRHPKRLFLVAALTVALTAGAFVAGGVLRAPSENAAAAGDTSIPVRVVVEERVVFSGIALPAAISPPATTPLTVSQMSVSASADAPAPQDTQTSPVPKENGSRDVAAPPPSDRIVVTATAVEPGTKLLYGQLLAEVAGRPIFAIANDVPLYRDLVIGSEGSDVLALQRFLRKLDYYGVTESSRLDSGTLDAVRRMYRAAGYNLPYISAGVPGVGWREFAAIPSQQVSVSARANVGTLLAADTALLTLETSPRTITATASVRDKKLLDEGVPLGVSVNGAAPVPVAVIEVSALGMDATTGAAGIPLRLSAPAELTIGASDRLVIESLSKPAPSKAVPLIAVHQENGDTFVLQEQEPTAEQGGVTYRRVKITITAQADGWAAISEPTDLAVGATLAVGAP